MPELLPVVTVPWGPHGLDKPDGVVVWLHGLGADGHDFEPIVPELGLPDDLSLRFVFPHAPVRPVTLNHGFEMRAWYDIKGMEFRRDEDEPGIRASHSAVNALVDAEIARGVPAERIVIAGFSQGGAMAYQVGLRHPQPFAGVLVLSAYLLLEDTLDAEAPPANRAVPILQCHGTADPVVPLAMGDHARQHLQEKGYGVDWHTYPVGHGLHPDEVRTVGRWLTKRYRPS